MIRLQNNNVNFGSLKVEPCDITKKAIKGYADCMDTIRIMADSFDRINTQSGETLIEIKGKITPLATSDIISFESFGAPNSSPLSKISIRTDDHKTSRADLFEKFCTDTLNNAKKLFK